MVDHSSTLTPIQTFEKFLAESFSHSVSCIISEISFYKTFERYFQTAKETFNFQPIYGIAEFTTQNLHSVLASALQSVNLVHWLVPCQPGARHVHDRTNTRNASISSPSKLSTRWCKYYGDRLHSFCASNTTTQHLTA